MYGKRQGFTLIELLVVISIIAILAAMLFPVFARARESARKIQCLSNVKNIAMALQIYLTDFDTMPPGEHDAKAVKYFQSVSGNSDVSWCASILNPYLRWPAILDEYIKNRDVWKCPSAKVSMGAYAIIPGPAWVDAFAANSWATGGGGNAWFIQPCCGPDFPPGWGGSVTDSFTQGVAEGGYYSWGNNEKQAFEQSIAVPEMNDKGLKMASVNDPARYIIVADGGVFTDRFEGLGTVAYPDLCDLDCATGNAHCSYPYSFNWANCPTTSSSDCVAFVHLHAPGDGSMNRDAHLRASYARHLGGTNLGFLDGHAQWMPADAIPAGWKDGTLEGISPSGPTSVDPRCAGTPGVNFWPII